MITDYGVKGLIGAGLRAKTTPMSDMIDALAPNVPSQLPAGVAERLDFLGAVPALRKWIGNREAKKVIQSLHTAVMEKHEATVDIPGEWIRNDKTGQVKEVAGGLVGGYQKWKSRLLFALLVDGAATTLGACFDGKALFADDHAWGKSTYDNKLAHAAATGTVPTANEAADAICEAIQALFSFKDDQGEPINEDMTSITIIAGTVIGNAIVQAVNQNHLDVGTGVRDNPVMGWKSANKLTINVIISPRYTDDDAFVMLNSSPGSCPVIFVENQGERIVSSKTEGSDYTFDNDAWQYGIQAVGVAACGRFTDAVQMTFT